MKIKDSELKALVAEVETEIGALLKAEKDKLAKAHPGEDTSAEIPPDESATASAKPPEASASASPAPDASAAPAPDASMPPADASAAPPADASADPAADEGTMDPEALKAEYAKLPPDELKIHFLAAKAALMEVMGGADDGSAGAPPPPAAPPAPPPVASASPSAPPALKAEMKSVDANGGKELPIKKSEQELQIEALKAEVTEQKDALEKLVKAVTVMVERPERKAVTSTAFIPKTDEAAKPLSKAEVMEKLKKVSAAPGLKKSDRDLINGFCVDAVSLEKIQHLLTDK